MAGLDPAIHVEPSGTVPGETIWMPASSAGLTKGDGSNPSLSS